MKKLLIISSAILSLLLLPKCNKDEVLMESSKVESLKSEFNLKEAHTNVAIPTKILSAEEAKQFLSEFKLQYSIKSIKLSNGNFKPSKLKSAAVETTTTKGTATKNGNIVTCTAPSGMGTYYTVTVNITSTSAISSNFSGLPVSVLITNYQQQADGFYNSKNGTYTANIGGYYTMGMNIEGHGLYSTHNYSVTMTYDSNNNTCTMTGKSW